LDLFLCVDWPLPGLKLFDSFNVAELLKTKSFQSNPSADKVIIKSVTCLTRRGAAALPILGDEGAEAQAERGLR